MGDPAGIGPEVITRCLQDPGIHSIARPLVIGDTGRLCAAAMITGARVRFRTIDEPSDARFDPTVVDVISSCPPVPSELPFGELSPIAGAAAYAFIQRAAAMAMSGSIDAICTAPINKEALKQAGLPFTGHTEILAEFTGTPEVSLALVLNRFSIVHVTTHLGIIDAIAKIEPGLVERTIDRALRLARQLGIRQPRTAVCGINPHAGEGGLFGYGEEQTKLEPALQRIRLRGEAVDGPVPADAAFFRAARGDYDVVVAMYHDQGHGPAKVLGLESGVNVTAGLKVVRTSVDHGTAFDIAGTGTADHRSLSEALRLAARLAGTHHTDRT